MFDGLISALIKWVGKPSTLTTTAKTVVGSLNEINSAKAAKAATPTAGHIATLDASGNPKDSGFSFVNVASPQEITGAYAGVNLATVFAEEIAEYGDPWAWIKARIQAENFEGLHVHDYIPVTCSNVGAYVLKIEIAGINTYKGSGATEIGTHIDFISRDCWPDAVTFNPATYNNGVGMDKFTATEGQTAFQLTYRGAGYPASFSSVTKNETATTDYTYVAETGILTYTGAALSAGDTIKAIWTNPVSVPFMASNLYAFINSLKMGVPNEAAADPFLTEVDYTAGGIYHYLPAGLKAVISKKRMYAATRFTAGSLLTATNNYADVEIGPLWIPDEREVFGSSVFATGIYEMWYSRWYPAFFSGRVMKGAGNGGSRTRWWLLSARSSNSSYFGISSAGIDDSIVANNTGVRPAVCFRIQKT